MSTKINIGALAAVGISSLLACQSAMSFSSYTEHNETRAYVALQWATGETSFTKPNVVLGVRQTTTDISNQVNGYDMSFVFGFGMPKLDAFRVGYLNGNYIDGLATVGLGYSFRKDTVLGFTGIVGPYAKVFGEMDGNMNLGVGLELNTLSRAGEREGSPATAPGPAPGPVPM